MLTINMKTNKNSSKQIWILSSLFINYLLVGSFIVGKSLYDLVYLIIFNMFNIIVVFNKSNGKSSSE